MTAFRSLVVPNQISPAASTDINGYADRSGSENLSATATSSARPTGTTPGNAARHSGSVLDRAVATATAVPPPATARTCTTSSARCETDW
jgi:hypothetical protein